MIETMFKRDYENYFAQEEKLRRLIFQWLPPEGSSLLDLGCKTGNITVHYQDKVKEVVGLDKDYTSILLAKRNFPGLIFLVGRVEELPIKTGSFNVLVISEVLQHVTEPQMAINEINRVLKPGGVLILSVPQKGFFYKYLHPGNIKGVGQKKRLLSPKPPRAIHYSSTTLRELLEGKFVLEESYRRGTILYPYSSKMLWLLVKLVEKGYCYGEERLKNPIIKGIYIQLLHLFYTILSWTLKRIMMIDFSLRLGKFSYNIIVRARRSRV